ncbi:hypothetical protein H8S95_11840 [Pontibacter sp. KCTC 32443]|uniref:hypothetical protein n=1 Tax=Pontibacter TaxID=323449 RepID=UPI00164DB112|nr:MULTISPECIES: hypothetical protein [Pontibacter]MBC5774757.1 hypothetical protein [Pontibacter sp. KCTC 32443]
MENGTVAKLSEEAHIRLQLITDTREELNDWFEFYGLDDDADTLFRLCEIWDTSMLTFPVTSDWQLLYKEHPTLFTEAPDDTRVLDIYTYGHTFLHKRGRRDKLTAALPDNEVAIVDLEEKKRTRLMFCSTVCQFHDSWWRSPEEIIVVGLIQGFDHKNLYPAIWRINTYTKQVQQFTSLKPAHPENNKNYLQENVLNIL